MLCLCVGADFCARCLCVVCCVLFAFCVVCFLCCLLCVVCCVFVPISVPVYVCSSRSVSQSIVAASPYVEDDVDDEDAPNTYDDEDIGTGTHNSV